MNVEPGQVEKVLDRLDIEVTEEIGDELWARCPNHRVRTRRDDRNPSWSINRETGVFLCFSCGWKGNLYTLLKDLRGADEARRELRLRRSSVTDRVLRAAPGEGRSLDRSFVRPVAVAPLRPRPMRGSALALFTDPPRWAMDRRNLREEAVALYGVRWDPDGDSWILPLHDPLTDDLWGYQVKAEGTRFFRNHPVGLAKSQTLFGYRSAVETGGRERVVVVESPLDAVLVSGLGCPAVAVCGSVLSVPQLELLRGFGQVGLALDNDDAGVREMTRVNRVLRTGMATFRVPWLGSGKDFGEMETEAVVDSLEAGGLL